MGVLFCAYDTPGLVASGPNAWIQRLVPDLMQNHQLDVQVLFIYKDELEQCPTVQFFKANNLPHHLISRTEYPFVEDQLIQLLGIIRDRNIKVLVANLVIPALYASKYLKASNIPVIGVLHSNDDFYDSVLNQFVDSDNGFLLTELVTVSDFLNSKADRINKHNIEITTISCGTPMRQDQDEKYLDEPLKIVYAGRLEEQQKQISKLTEAFISAADRLENSRFTIYGSGSAQASVEKLIAESNHSRVQYGGAIPPSHIKEELAKHHVFTLMSDYEGMPIALMEAMSLGLVPVCLQEDSGIAEIIDHEVNGFIVSDRQANYRSKIEYLANNPEVYTAMSKAAIQKIKSTHSQEVTGALWSNLLKKYSTNETKRVRIPKCIKLPTAKLYYGDLRKPKYVERVKKKVKAKWLNFRLFVRPRKRLQMFLKQLRGG